MPSRVASKKGWRKPSLRLEEARQPSWAPQQTALILTVARPLPFGYAARPALRFESMRGQWEQTMKSRSFIDSRSCVRHRRIKPKHSALLQIEAKMDQQRPKPGFGVSEALWSIRPQHGGWEDCIRQLSESWRSSLISYILVICWRGQISIENSHSGSSIVTEVE